MKCVYTVCTVFACFVCVHSTHCVHCTVYVHCTVWFRVYVLCVLCEHVCLCLSVCFKQTTLVECIRTLLTKVYHVIHHTLYNTSIQFCDLLLELNQ